MTNITLTQRKFLVAQIVASETNDIVKILAKAEKVAPVNVHSHGRLIESAIDHAEKLIIALKAVQTEVQGR